MPSYLVKRNNHIFPSISHVLGLPIDGGGHEDKVGSQESLDQGERDRGCFVDNNQLCLGKLCGVP